VLRPLILHLRAAAASQPAPDVPVPQEYLFYRWRKEMGVSWLEMTATPYREIMRDLEFMELEGEYLKPKEAKPNA
jgi:hypothetical protein